MHVLPTIHYINREVFERAEGIYKIISHEPNNTCACFELQNRKYYIGYFSSNIIRIEMRMLEKESYLLIGVDLRVVVLCVKTGSILLSLGLFSVFKGFEDTNDILFTVFTDLEDIVINKNGLSISQTIGHDLEF